MKVNNALKTIATDLELMQIPKFLNSVQVFIDGKQSDIQLFFVRDDYEYEVLLDEDAFDIPVVKVMASRTTLNLPNRKESLLFEEEVQNDEVDVKQFNRIKATIKAHHQLMAGLKKMVGDNPL